MIYSTRQFSYNPETKTFSAEASDLQGGTGAIYDSVETTHPYWRFTIESHRTGERADFSLDFSNEGIKRDSEGDILSWTLRPLPETLKKNPALSGVTIVIFND